MYASLAALLNHNRGEFGEDFMRRLSKTLDEALANSDATPAKLLLRLLAEVTNSNMVPIEVNPTLQYLADPDAIL